MTMGVSNVGQAQLVQANALKKMSEQDVKVKDMPMDAVSFGNKEEEKSGSKVGIVATVIGAAALIGAGIHASHGMERTHIEGIINTIKLVESYIDNINE